MIYEYKCKNCNIVTEVYQSIKDKTLTFCDSCHEHALERVIYGGVHASVEQEPKTLKQQAERNTKKMGKYELQERERKDKVQSKKVAQELNNIAKMTPEQQRKYIENG